MNNMVAVALTVGGLLLLVLGFSARDSSDFDVSMFYTDAREEKSVWMLVAGLVLTVLGLEVGWSFWKGA